MLDLTDIPGYIESLKNELFGKNGRYKREESTFRTGIPSRPEVAPFSRAAKSGNLDKSV